MDRMEFVIVTCDDRERPVFVDNQEQGVTGRRLSLPEGVHVFDLGADDDYTPRAIEMLVERTDPDDPMPILFEAIEAAIGVARALRRKRKRAAAGTRKKARKRKKTSPSRSSAGKGSRKASKRRRGKSRTTTTGRKKR